MPTIDEEKKCSLTCTAKGTGETYTLREKVKDGTPCMEDGSHICVDGSCQRLGCDGQLSDKRIDVCGKCGGDGSTCYTIRRSYALVNHFTGYNDIFEIPMEATNIQIVERHPGKHYLALRDKTGKYYLNGDWKIEKSKRFEAAGTSFVYHHPTNTTDEAETLTSVGPTKEGLMLTLLYQDPDPDVKVQYEYSLPLDAEMQYPLKDGPEPSPDHYLEMVVKDDGADEVIYGSKNNINKEMENLSIAKADIVQYIWISGTWNTCSEECGEGHQTRHVKCLQTGTNSVVDQHFCQKSSKPSHRQKCNTLPCKDISCISSPHGCCPDGFTPAKGSNMRGCHQALTDSVFTSCLGTMYGCCEGGVQPATGPNQEGCPKIEKLCGNHGCCSDGITPAEGPNQEGCHVDSESCLQPRKKGKCRARLVRWYFDRKLKACKKFFYGGCKGNKNRFASKELCENTCRSLLSAKLAELRDQDVCNLPEDMRQCAEPIVKWFYDKANKKCEQYWFGGCSKGGNHFDTEDACKQRCHTSGEKSAKPASTALTEISICRLPSNPGPCQQGVKRWYYDVIRKECITFMYGGCKGNLNNFKTLGECMKQCDPWTKLPTEKSFLELSAYPARCLKSKDERLCSDWVSKWFFNSKEERCEEFWQGGCDEDGHNVFHSENDCRRTCRKDGLDPQNFASADDCRLPKDEGPCFSSVSRWYYDTAYGSCLEFMYGGCRGNKNNFNSEEECILRCDRDSLDRPPVRPVQPVIPRPTSNVCNLAKNEQLCGEWSTKWYYDKDSGRCETFWHGGCREVGNVFDSKVECERTCRGSSRPTTRNTGNTGIRGDTDVCGQDADPGDCRSFEKRWYYHYLEGDCFTFDYGGCGGNKNNFFSRDACVRQCMSNTRPTDRWRERERPPTGERPRTGDRSQSDVCLQPTDERLCGKWTSKYRYNSTNARCEQFWHGGCRSDGNVFESEHDCRRKCQGVASRRSDSDRQDNRRRHIDDVLRIRDRNRDNRLTHRDDTRHNRLTHHESASTCSLPADKGPCRAIVQRWHYDSALGDCRMFVYGGCQGNANNYHSRRECLQKCSAGRSQAWNTARSSPRRHSLRGDDPDAGDLCLMAVDDQLCTEWIERWLFNKTVGKCQRFWHGGCDGISNNFESQEACWTKCYDHAQNAKAEPAEEIMVTVRPEVTPEPEPRTRQPEDPRRRQPEDTRRRQPEDHGRQPEDPRRRQPEDPRRREPEDHGRQPEDPRHGQPDDPGRQPEDPRRRQPENPKHHPDRADICSLPKDERSCIEEPVVKWYYKFEEAECDRFWYGGCNDDGNQFDSREDCLRMCEGHRAASDVSDRRETKENRPRGHDTEDIDRDEQIEAERRRIEAERRRTEDRDEARRRQSPDPDQSNSPVHTTTDVCQLPFDSGLCLANFPRWYYDSESDQCKRFTFGGCGGNGNNFENKRACRQMCMHNQRPRTNDQQDPDQDRNRESDKEDDPLINTLDRRDHSVCGMLADDRFCGDWVLRWVYNQTNEVCQQLWLGNCGKGGNQFNSQDDCLNLCHNNPLVNRPPTIDQPDHYPDDNIIRGSVNDNERRYEDDDDSVDFDVCMEKSDAGPCRDNIVALWYYDSEQKACARFQYGGCEGNGNRFETEEECERACTRRLRNSEDRRRERPHVDDRRQQPPPTAVPRRRVTFAPRRMGDRGTLQCRNSQFGCCPDGITPAGDDNFNTCIAAAPKIYPLGKNSVVVRSGDDVIIPCEVTGAPRPTVVWYQDGVRIPTDSTMFTFHTVGSMMISAVKSKDAGEYTCTADNGIGKRASRRVKLVVQESPLIMGTPSSVFSPPGKSAYLHCLATGNPPPDVSWLDRDGRTIRNDSRFSSFSNGSLIISPAQPEDGGLYTCLARSGVAAPVRKTVNLLVKERVEASIMPHDNMYGEGGVLHLTCDVTGYPYPSIVWLKDDIPLNNSHRVRLHDGGRKLSVHQLEIADAGLYQCKAINGEADDIASTLVRVDLKEMTDEECVDPQGKVYCRIIVAAKMCHRRHFKRLCCESCKEWLLSKK